MDISKNILFEDEGIIVLYKPAGVPVQSKSITVMDLESAVKNYLSKSQKGQPYLGIVHRLDQPVEGIVLFAKNQKAAAVLSKEINNGTIEKYYKAVCVGKPKNQKGELIDYLKKDAKTNLAIISGKEENGAKKSCLSYELLGVGIVDLVEVSKLDIRLYTGRHHQIRAQLSNMGIPIVGDRKYGKENIIKSDFPALAAYRLRFTNPSTGEMMDIKIEPKGDMFNIF